MEASLCIQGCYTLDRAGFRETASDHLPSSLTVLVDLGLSFYGGFVGVGLERNKFIEALSSGCMQKRQGSLAFLCLVYSPYILKSDSGKV
jgi:hypothetical protein